MKTSYKLSLFPLKTALFCCPIAWSIWPHVHQALMKWGKWTGGWRTGEGSLHLAALCWRVGYGEIFSKFKMTLPWVSALKPRINSFWIANSALGDLPEGLEGEAGRKQRVIPRLLQWFWNQTSVSKPEWMQQRYCMPHIQGLFFLCILTVQAFNPRNSSEWARSDRTKLKAGQVSLFTVHLVGGKSRYIDKRLFLQESLLSFYVLHKFTDTPAINFQSAFFFFPYKGQYKNLTSLTGNVTLEMSSPELLINISVPNRMLCTSQDRLKCESTLTQKSACLP